MAADPGTTTKTIKVDYPSHHGEIPIGFLIHNKGLWNSFNVQEYFFISQNSLFQSGSWGLRLNISDVTAIHAEFSADVNSSITVEAGAEIAPIYASDLGLI